MGSYWCLLVCAFLLLELCHTLPLPTDVSCVRYTRSLVRIQRENLGGPSRTKLPEVYAHISKLRQETFCLDTRQIVIDPNQHVIHLPGNVAMRLIDPLPAYITVYSGTKDWVSNDVLSSGYWDYNELNQLLWALKAPLPPNSAATSTIGPALYVDVGANVGSFSLHIAARGFEVIAFEGMRDNQWLVRTSMCASAPAIMSRMTLHAFGLGDKQQTCYLITDFNHGNGIPVCGAHNGSHAEALYGEPGHTARGVMQIERLDDVVQRDIKVLKIDVEGFEPMVLKGGLKLLQTHTVWFLEFEYNILRLRSTLKGTGIKYYQHILDLKRMGYRISVASFAGPYLEEAPLIAHLEAVVELCNLYCIHPRYNLPINMT